LIRAGARCRWRTIRKTPAGQYDAHAIGRLAVVYGFPMRSKENSRGAKTQIIGAQ